MGIKGNFFESTHPSCREGELAEVPVWPGKAPGSENWTQKEQEYLFHGTSLIRNVTQPTLTPYLPDPSKANGTAVIVCPGGGFTSLVHQHEGQLVAEWLRERGIAAFLLKYRLYRTSQIDEVYIEETQAFLRDFNKLLEIGDQIGPLAGADACQAIKIVREQAAKWNIRPDRIGIMGFSAGANVTLRVALEYEAQSRPDFAAMIYGALWKELVVPDDAPPIFIAFSNDDKLAVDPGLRLFSSWREAGHSAELHIYSAGGHGYGMLKQNLPSDKWIECLKDWLKLQGFA